jgi:hypothetical protein
MELKYETPYHLIEFLGLEGQFGCDLKIRRPYKSELYEVTLGCIGGFDCDPSKRRYYRAINKDLMLAIYEVTRLWKGDPEPIKINRDITKTITDESKNRS